MRVWVLAGLAGCGLPDRRPLVELDHRDVQELCGEPADASWTCEADGVVYDSVLDAERCVDEWELQGGCGATVGDWRACTEAYGAALDADPCLGDGLPDACAPVVDCLPVGAAL